METYDNRLHCFLASGTAALCFDEQLNEDGQTGLTRLTDVLSCWEFTCHVLRQRLLDQMYPETHNIVRPRQPVPDTSDDRMMTDTPTSVESQ